MNLRCLKNQNRGMTRVEVVIVIICVTVLAFVFLPALIPPGPHPLMKISCANGLKQMGLAFAVWAGDNNDKFPMAVSVTNGGAMEMANQGNAGGATFFL
jgi:competence protein ComGC